MPEISLFNLSAVVITLAAVFGYINHRWLGLPHTIGVVLIALLASIGVIIIDAIAPALGDRKARGGATQDPRWQKTSSRKR